LFCVQKEENLCAKDQAFVGNKQKVIPSLLERAILEWEENATNAVTEMGMKIGKAKLI